MVESPTYPVGTIFEMAAIPEEAFPRFLSELPEMVAMLRRMLAMNVELETFGAKIEPQTPVWIDDDKGTGTVRILSEGEEVASMKVKLPSRGDA